MVSITIASFCFPLDAKRGQVEDAVSCRFNGSSVVANCILRSNDGTLSIANEVLRELQFDSYGLAQVRSEDNSREPWMYVTRNGRVVVVGVPNFDNWADEFSDGLVRTVLKGKYGFANRHGKVVIRPAYDWASPFWKGYAEVCNGCREVCAMPGHTVELQSVPGGCDHRVMVGGKWFRIDATGRVVAKLRR
jgi:WG containing repeat